MRRPILPLLLALGAGPALAEAPSSSEPPPPPPLIEQRPSDPPVVTPEVRIVPRPEATVEEYRINGELYMIRVIPKKGRPYYLLDADGDGRLETRSEELDPKIMVPGWLIFRW